MSKPTVTTPENPLAIKRFVFLSNKFSGMTSPVAIQLVLQRELLTGTVELNGVTYPMFEIMEAMYGQRI